MRVPGERVRFAGLFSGVDLSGLDSTSARSLGRRASAGGRPPLLPEITSEALEVLHSPLIECPCGCKDPRHDPLSDHLSDPFREELR